MIWPLLHTRQTNRPKPLSSRIAKRKGSVTNRPPQFQRNQVRPLGPLVLLCESTDSEVGTKPNETVQKRRSLSHLPCPKSSKSARVFSPACPEQMTSQLAAQADHLQTSMEELSSQVITFGKTHRGRTYHDMWEQESKYCQWFLSTYEKSTKIERRRFIHFLEMKIERAELELSLPDVAQGSSGTQVPIHPRAKVQAKSKMMAKSRPATNPKTSSTSRRKKIRGPIWETRSKQFRKRSMQMWLLSRARWSPTCRKSSTT